MKSVIKSEQDFKEKVITRYNRTLALTVDLTGKSEFNYYINPGNKPNIMIVRQVGYITSAGDVKNVVIVNSDLTGGAVGAFYSGADMTSCPMSEFTLQNFNNGNFRFYLTDPDNKAVTTCTGKLFMILEFK
jgi:hypothetical protein